MIEFEKLGLFYLGREVDPDTRQPGATPLLYDSADLVTHGVIVGMTGSGKTGLGVGLIEEAAIDAVPVIAIDPKGDLGNLLLTFPGLSGAEFAPWIDPDEARRAGMPPDAFADAEAARWARGLADWGQDGARIARLREAADFTIYTPGSTSGRPISIGRSFSAPPAAVVADEELLADRVSTAATSVLALAGIDAEPLTSREHVLLSTLLVTAWRAGQSLDLPALIAQVQSPPVTRVGVLDLDAFFPAKDRFALAVRLNQLVAAPGFAAWLDGEPLDIDHLLYGAGGRPRVSIISIAHLDDRERMFFVSLLLNEVVAWMRAQRGTTSLRALLYFDEVFGFLPPVANPPSKAPLLRLLKQGRAFGVGVTVATQNPVDLDYKALANAGTWMLGRLQTERDKARVLEGLEGLSAGPGFDRASVDRILSSLGKRMFLLHNVHEKQPTLFETRWALSYLRGPLGRDEIRRLTPAASASDRADTGELRRDPAGAPSGREGESAAPVLDPAVPQFFLPGAGTRLVPMLVGCARIRYADARMGIDETRDVCVTTPIADAAVPVDWQHAEPADFAVGDLTKAPADAAIPFAPLPSAAADPRKYAGWEKDFARWAAQSQSVDLFRSPSTGLVSAPDESERAFRIRVATAAREGRDAELARIRDKHASRLSTLDDRVRRATHARQVQAEQASGAKVQAAISVAATALGALFGRRVASAGTVSKAATAARGMGRAGREAQDVARADANLDAATRQLDEAREALDADLQAASARWEAASGEFDRVLVKPKRGGVAVQVVALVWVPAGGRS